MASSFELLAPANKAFAITTSDSDELPVEVRGIYVGVAGNIVVSMIDPVTHNLTSVTFLAAPVGNILPIRTKKIFATGTTATNLIGLL